MAISFFLLLTPVTNKVPEEVMGPTNMIRMPLLIFFLQVEWKKRLLLLKASSIQMY